MLKKSLSVLIPNYNYGRYIKESLEAILSQSYEPLEVLVCDDGSTDNSVEVVESFMKKYPILKLLRNKKNMGAPYTAQRLLGVAKGDYVIATASDDKLLPGYFKKSMDLLSKNPIAGLCCTDSVYLKKGKIISGVCPNIRSFPSYITPEETVEVLRSEAFTLIVPHTTIYRKEALLEVGGWREELKWSADTFAMHVMAFRYGFCYVPEKLVQIRRHNVQLGHMPTKKPNMEREIIKTEMDLLETDKFKDVLPMFKSAAPFSSSPWQTLRVAMFDNKYREFLSLKVIKYGVSEILIRQWLLRFLPTFLLDHARNMVNKIRKIKSIIRNLSKGKK